MRFAYNNRQKLMYQILPKCEIKNVTYDIDKKSKSVTFISVRIFPGQFTNRISVTVSIISVFFFGLVVNFRGAYVLLPVVGPIEILGVHITRPFHVLADYNTVYKTAYQSEEAED